MFRSEVVSGYLETDNWRSNKTFWSVISLPKVNVNRWTKIEILLNFIDMQIITKIFILKHTSIDILIVLKSPIFNQVFWQKMFFLNGSHFYWIWPVRKEGHQRCALQTLLAFIANSDAQSSAQTHIHSAIVVIDTSNNAWYSQVHWLVGTPYLAVKASNALILRKT